MRVCTGTRVPANTGVPLKRFGEIVIKGSGAAIIISCPEDTTTLRLLSRALQSPSVKAFYCDRFVLPLPEGHRFPMEKYSRLRERVPAAGVVAPEELIVPHAATDEEILRVHDPEYLRRVAAGELSRAETRRIGFPW